MRPIVVAIGAFVSACSIHPVPEEVGPKKTLHIAQRIRCEAREAVKARFVKEAEKSDHHPTRKLASRLSSEVDFTFKDLKYSELDKPTRDFFEKYDGTGVAYDFLFDITESGGAGIDVDVLRTLSGGVLSAGVGAGLDLSRQNLRAFPLNDTFASLLIKLSRSQCDQIETGENWVYPIRGSIGLAEMVDTFIDLNETGALAKGDNDSPTIIDTLEFTTTLALSAHPSLVLNAAGRRWQPTKITASETGVHVGRTDKNKITVAFSEEIVKAPSTGPAAKVASQKGTRTPAERSASQAIINQKSFRFITNSLQIQSRTRLPDPR